MSRVGQGLIYVWCIHGVFGREMTKYVGQNHMYTVHIQ